MNNSLLSGHLFLAAKFPISVLCLLKTGKALYTLLSVWLNLCLSLDHGSGIVNGLEVHL